MAHRFPETLVRAVAIVGLSAGAVLPAHAQTSGVVVDLSALSSGGYGGVPYTSTPYTSNSDGTLMMPGTTLPKSRYFGPAVTVTDPLPTAPATNAPTPSAATLTAPDIVPPPIPEPVPDSIPEPVVASETPVTITEAPAAPKVPDVESITVEKAAETPEVMNVAEEEPMDMAEEETATEAPPSLPDDAVQPVAQVVTLGITTEEESVAEAETAMISSDGSDAEPGRSARITFDGNIVKLPDSFKPDLDAIIATISADEDLRIRLNAYSGGEDLTSSKARRMSLSRALNVRSYLIEQGVRSTRIDVRALGDKTDEKPLNRVDVDITER